MLTDYFAFGVALDALSSAVPGENSAFRTKEENGIVLHALDKQAENLVALTQALLRVLVLKLFQRLQSFPFRCGRGEAKDGNYAKSTSLRCGLVYSDGCIGSHPSPDVGSV